MAGTAPSSRNSSHRAKAFMYMLYILPTYYLTINSFLVWDMEGVLSLAK